MRVKALKWLGKGVAAAALTTAAAAGSAQNLVSNGDFETGTFAGWTAAINLGTDAVDTLTPQAGLYGAYFGSNTPSTISQDLATTSGQTYMVSFWLKNEDYLGHIPNSFAFNWNGQQVMGFADADVFDYTQYTFLLDAWGASTSLSFSFVQENGFLDFDSVDVHAVPEPGSLALAGLAGLLAVSVSRRRKRASTALETTPA